MLGIAMNFTEIAASLGHSGLLVLVALVVLIVAKVAVDRITPFDDAQEVEGENNLAAALSRAGIYVAIVIGMLGALAGTGDLPMMEEATWFAIDGAVVAAAAILGQWVLRRILLPGVRLREAVASQNVAVGTVEFAISVATGLVAFGSFAGPGGTYAVALGFVGIGILALGATVLILDRVYGGRVKDVRDGNVPAGILLAGQVVSCGIILEMAINGPSEGWAYDLMNFGLWFVVGLLFNLAAAFVVDLLFLPKSKQADWIREGRNAPAVLQASIHVALAALVAMAL